MSFIINQNFDLKSPQFNFARDYYKDIATLKAESEDNFPDHFITNVAGTLYQITKSNSVDATTGKWRALKFGLTSGEIDAKGYATKTELKDAVNHIIVGASANNTDIAVKNDKEGYSLDAVIPVVSDSLNGVMTPAQKKALEAATTKLAGIAEGANKTVVDDSLKPDSTNPVQNKVVKAALDNKASLGEDGKVDSSILPNDVYDVLEFGGIVVDATIQQQSTNVSGTIVYVQGKKTFAMRVNKSSSSDGGLSTITSTFYSNWLDRQKYCEILSNPYTGKLYVDTTTNKLYRWSGEALVEVSAGVTIGETSTTAYAGDKGAKNATDIGNLTTAFNNFKGSVTSIEVCDTVTIDAMFAQ